MGMGEISIELLSYTNIIMPSINYEWLFRRIMDDEIVPRFLLPSTSDMEEKGKNGYELKTMGGKDKRSSVSYIDMGWPQWYKHGCCFVHEVCSLIS